MVYDKSALKHMREAGLRLTEVIYKLREEVVAGITGEELDTIAEKLILSLNSIPSFKGYGGFPASVCISVDDVVIHGIPSKRPLLPGQLVSIDLGLIYDGWNSDAAFTVILPPVQEGKKKLSDVTLKALRSGVSKIKPGIHLGDISAQIQKVAQEAGVGIVRDFTGHGIGRHLHEDPPIPNLGVTRNLIQRRKRIQTHVYRLLQVFAIVNNGKRNSVHVVAVLRKPFSYFVVPVA